MRQESSISNVSSLLCVVRRIKVNNTKSVFIRPLYKKLKIVSSATSAI
ncbi:hypothetical protein DSUL_140059 [Desulfovibrionales bacterium]